MAETNPALPQSYDDQLILDYITALTAQGPLGRLNMGDMIVPVAIVSAVRPIEIGLPAYRPEEIFRLTVTGPASEAVLADTGQLTAGTYDVYVSIATEDTSQRKVELQQRNAANDANRYLVGMIIGGTSTTQHQLRFAAVVAEDERLRFQTAEGFAGAAVVYSTIFAKRRT